MGSVDSKIWKNGIKSMISTSSAIFFQTTYILVTIYLQIKLSIEANVYTFHFSLLLVITFVYRTVTYIYIYMICGIIEE